MLINKYKPKDYKEIIGQELSIRSINNWLNSWKQGEALLLYGPTGVGKTLVTNVIANERKMHLLEINPSDPRSLEALNNLNETLKQKSLSGKMIVLIDEVDNFFPEDKGGVAELIKIIDESKHPVILTANNPFDQKLRSLREKCKLLKMRNIPVNLIFKKLKQISYKEIFKVSDEFLYKVAINSKGDVRSAINDMEIAATGNFDLNKREKELDIFNLLKLLFKTRDIKKISEAIEKCEKDFDEIIWWVEHNILNEYEKPEEIAEAFDTLSRADLHRSRIIKNQNYRLEKYAKYLVAAVSLAKRKTYYKFTPYKYPARLILLGESKVRRMEKEILLEKLAKQLHCSKRIVNMQLPYLEIITNNFKDM